MVDWENVVPVFKIRSHVIRPDAVFSPTGSRIPMKLWDTARSDERLAKLRKSHCELLTRKLGKVGDKASGVQREQTEIKKPKSWSRHKEVAWGELCDLRHGILVGFLIFFIFILYARVSAYMCVCVPMHETPQSQKRASDYPDPELETTEPSCGR